MDKLRTSAVYATPPLRPKYECAGSKTKLMEACAFALGPANFEHWWPLRNAPSELQLGTVGSKTTLPWCWTAPSTTAPHWAAQFLLWKIGPLAPELSARVRHRRRPGCGKNSVHSQPHATEEGALKEPYDAEHRMRHKFQRWNLTVLPRWAAARAFTRLNYLHEHAPPRVSAAALSTLWNRRTTARRFQLFAPRCLGCSDTAADSIEHYAHCPLIRSAAETELRLQLREWPHTLGDFMLITRPTCNDPRVTQERILLRMALLVAAVYRVTGAARRRRPRTTQETHSMVRQALLESVKNHPNAAQELHTVWAPSAGVPTPTRPAAAPTRGQRLRPRPQPY